MPKIKMNSWLMNWTGFVTRNTQAEFDDIKFEDGPEWMQLMWESWLKNSDHGWKILEKKRIKKQKMIGKENRSTLEIILDSLSDDDWKSISLIRDTKEAFKKSDTIKKIKSGSIKFAEWILEKGIETHSGYYVKENNRYTAEELYLAYRRGDFEDFEDGSDD